MSSKDSEEQARRRAAKMDKLKVQQDRAVEANAQQRQADAARDQKTARLRALRMAAAEQIELVKEPVSKARTPAVQSAKKVRRAVTG